MQRTDLTFRQIYNRLLSGERIVLYFDSADSAENFRTRMHHHKSKQQAVLEKLGMTNDDEQTQFKFRTQPDDKSQAVVAYAAFVLPSPLKKYQVLILEDKDQESAEVSKSMGETQS